MEDNKAIQVLSAETRAAMLQGEQSVFLNIAKFEHAQRVAKMLQEAKMWPEHIRSTGDALIILNMADRMGADPFMLAQRVYIVHGKPGLEGKLVISLINNSGKYSEPLRFEFSGARDADPSDTYDQDQDAKQTDSYGCRAITVDKRSGKTVRGPKITWKIVKAEGWLGKNGSKWKTMAELMFQYRSASWFANVNCPEVTLGLPTADELRDIVELEPTGNGKYALPEAATKPITFNDEPTPPPTEDKPKRTRRTKAEIEAERAQAKEFLDSMSEPPPAPQGEEQPAHDPEADELAAVRSELEAIYEATPGYLMQAQRNLQMAVGRALPPTLDGCRVLLEEIRRLKVERGAK